MRGFFFVRRMEKNSIQIALNALHFIAATITLKGQVLQHLAFCFALTRFVCTVQWLQQADAGQLKLFLSKIY